MKKSNASGTGAADANAADTGATASNTADQNSAQGNASDTDALLALEAGKLDASLQRWEDNEQRRKKYLFTNEYYLTYTQNVTVWGDRDDIKSLDDLDGKTVLVKAAGGSDDYFWQNYIAQSGANKALAQLREEGFLSELSKTWYGADYSVNPYK